MGFINNKKPNMLFRMGGGSIPTGTKTITANGTYDVAEYANADVNVPQPSGVKTIRLNGIYDVFQYDEVDVMVPQPIGTKTITANGTYNVFQYEDAEVNVPQGVFPSGTKSITENGTYDVESFENVEVDVPTGETPTGTKTITANGTYDVVNFANAEVNVPQGIVPTGTKTITENGTYDITNYANVVVDTPVYPSYMGVIDFTVDSVKSNFIVPNTLGWVPSTLMIYVPDNNDFSLVDVPNSFVQGCYSPRGTYTFTSSQRGYNSSGTIGYSANPVFYNSFSSTEIWINASFAFRPGVTYRIIMFKPF